MDNAVIKKTALNLCGLKQQTFISCSHHIRSRQGVSVCRIHSGTWMEQSPAWMSLRGSRAKAGSTWKAAAH